MGTIKFKNTTLNLIKDITHYYEEMSLRDRTFLRNTIDVEPLFGQYKTTTQHILEDSEKRGYIIIDVDHREDIGLLMGYYVKPEFRLEKTTGPLAFTKSVSFALAVGGLFYAFDYLDLRKIETGAHGANEMAISIYDRFLVREGLKRNHNRYLGKLYDKPLYGLLKEEFEERFAKYRKYLKGLHNEEDEEEY